MTMEDLEQIIPDFVKPSSRSLRYIFLAVVGVLLLIVIVMGCLVGVQMHHGLTSSPTGSTSEQKSAAPGMCTSTQCLEVAARMAENMNTSADPCQDFYKFACTGWELRARMRLYHQTESVAHGVQHDNMERMREILESSVDNKIVSSAERKLKHFYQSCVNDYRRMGEGGKVLFQLIKDSFKGWYVLDPEGWQNNGWDLQEAITTMMANYSVPLLVSTSIGRVRKTSQYVIIVYSGRIGMLRKKYTSEDSTMADAYKEYMRAVATALLEDGNVTMDDSTKQQRLQQFVDDAYGQEAKIAALITSGSKVKGYYRYHKVKLAEIERNFTQIAWRSILSRVYPGYTLTDDTDIWVYALPYLVHLDQLLRNETQQHNKERIMNNYIIWRFLNVFTDHLSWKYLTAKKQFYEKVYGFESTAPTWLYCQYTIYRIMPFAMAKEYLISHIGADSRDQVAAMFEVLQSSLAEHLDSLTWMDNATAAIGKKKILNVDKEFGFPGDFFTDNFVNNLYNDLTINITDGYLTNYMRGVNFQQRTRSQNLQAGHAPLWHFNYRFASFGTNPYLETATGFFLVPAGAMRYPLFLKDGPLVFNYGTLGFQILTQLTQSVGEKGRTLTPDGTEEDWWSAATDAKYQAEKACFVDYFNGTSLGPYEIDGKSLTVPVLASRQATDIIHMVAGLKSAIYAYRSLQSDPVPPGINMTADQIFFVSAAQTQCFIQTAKGAYRDAKRNNIPPDLMLNAALSYTEEFAQAFNCPNMAPMVQEDKCTVF